MEIPHAPPTATRLQKGRDIQPALMWVCIAGGLALSVVSFIRLCSQACAEGHQYRLYGLPLDPIGIFFFFNLALIYFLSTKYDLLNHAFGALLASAVGAEAVFIYFQKVKIGHWCPVCLSIAAIVVVATLFNSLNYFHALQQSIKQRDRSQLMHLLKTGSAYVSIALLTIVVTFMGMVKVDKLAAAEESIKDKLIFGNTSSPIEVYFFTDWQCPACRKVEKSLEKMTPAVEKLSKLIFVDYAVHPESLNFTPYNVSFMVNNKDKYWQLRHILSALSLTTTTPTEEQVQQEAKKIGVTYKELFFADVTLSIKYFKQLGDQFKLEGTPTVVIVNRATKKGKKFAGTSEITEATIVQGINDLKK